MSEPRNTVGDAADEGARYAALEWISQAVWVFDIDRGRVHWANSAALELWQAETLAELSARDMGADMSPAVAQRLRQYQQDFERGQQRFTEQWTLYPRGVPRTVRVIFSAHRLADGRMAMLCEGIGEQAGDPESLRSVEALLHTSVMISLYDRHGHALYRNPAARDALPAPGAGLRIADDNVRRQILDALAQRGEARVVTPVQTREGLRWHEISSRLCRDAVSGEEAYLVSEVDVSDLKQTEARANYLAMHDTLTGLPNRNYVLERFPGMLQALAAAGQTAALIFVDLDHFKNINDSLGHAAGDGLLVQMAARLNGLVGARDLVARLGGDEFLVLAPLAAPDQDVDDLTRRIHAVLSQPVRLQQGEVAVTPSIGVSLFPRDGADVDTLMRHADVAMYRVKDQGRNGVACFTAEMGARVQTRLALENELRHAIRRGQLDVYYQPRLDIASGTLVGAEALVRWRHPERGVVSPALFVPIAEELGMIHDLSALVLERAARQRMAWRQAGHELNVSVNLSPHTFRHPHLLADLCEIIHNTGCDPEGIELEITESVLMGHDQQTINSLEALSVMGFSIAIDDFGTGYSNLAYLQRYPIHTLKIDRSFVQGIGDSTPLTEMIISMCGMLKLKMVAEGVELQSQLDWLRERGVQEFQGFLYSPPLPVAQFDELLANALPGRPTLRPPLHGIPA